MNSIEIINDFLILLLSVFDIKFLKPAKRYNLKSGRLVNDVPIPLAINLKLVEISVG
jgi:hypothetical protein